MNNTAYAEYLKTTIESLDQAITTALATLPKQMQEQYYIAARHAPDRAAAWESVRWHYAVKKEISEEVEQALDALVMMGRAASCLRTILLERPTTPLDLSLPKVRSHRGHCQ